MAGWVHHIDITVSDLAVSTAFYERVMPVLDFHRIADNATGEPLWAGDRIELCLMRAQPASLRPHDRYSPGLHHLAFGASTRGAVDRAHRELVALGVRILDPPGDTPRRWRPQVPQLQQRLVAAALVAAWRCGAPPGWAGRGDATPPPRPATRRVAMRAQGPRLRRTR